MSDAMNGHAHDAVRCVGRVDIRVAVGPGGGGHQYEGEDCQENERLAGDAVHSGPRLPILYPGVLRCQGISTALPSVRKAGK